MATPNSFLQTSTTANGRHRRGCLCSTCQNIRVAALTTNQYSNEELFHRIFGDLDQQEEVRLNRLFSNTMMRLNFGKVYTNSCLYPNTRYSRWGCWARTQPRLARLPDKVFDKMCTHISEINIVFAQWDLIRSNLTDHRMTNIEARKFSIHDFYMARNLAWCVSYNEMHRAPGHHDPDNPEYPEQTLQTIITFICNSGIYQWTTPNVYLRQSD